MTTRQTASRSPGDDAILVNVRTDAVNLYFDRIHSLAEVPEGIHYVKKGHSRGLVVISIG